MPRNKLEQQPAEKRQEIVDAARSLFLDVGYESISMKSIASAAGVASNTIYWYFKDKDELLVAVLDTEFERGLLQFLNSTATDSTDRLLMVVNQLQQASRLVATVHARMHLSPAIGVWHEHFHELIETLIQAEMNEAGIPSEKAKSLVKVWVFTVEGLLAHETSEVEKREICTVLAGGVAH